MYVNIPIKLELNIFDIKVDFENKELGRKYIKEWRFLDRIATSMLETASLGEHYTIAPNFIDLIIKNVEDFDFINNEGLIIKPKIERHKFDNGENDQSNAFDLILLFA